MKTTTGHVAIQCSHSGKTGTFLFRKEEGKTISDSELLTPVCADMIELCRYMNANGWKQDSHLLNSTYSITTH